MGSPIPMTSLTQASDDRSLDRTAGKQSTTGSRLLAIGGVMALFGIFLMAIGGPAIIFVGVLFAALATPVTLAGLALTLSGLVGGRPARHKDFA